MINNEYCHNNIIITHFFDRVVEVWLNSLDVRTAQKACAREALKMNDQTPRQVFIAIQII